MEKVLNNLLKTKTNNMKKSNFKNTVLVMLSILTFISCSSDDDSGSISEELLLGKWQYKDYIVNGNAEPHNHIESCDSKDYLEFSSNEKFSQGYYLGNCEPEITTFNYQLNGDKIIVTVGTASNSIDIINLTEKELSLKGSYDFDGDGSIDDVIENYER